MGQDAAQRAGPTVGCRRRLEGTKNLLGRYLGNRSATSTPWTLIAEGPALVTRIVL